MSFFVLVAGGSGSGKSTVVLRLGELFCNMAEVLCHDNYYKQPSNLLSDEERAKINYDSPEAYDNELFLSHLAALKSGNAIECPIYNFGTHERTDMTWYIEPKEIILIDGILVLENEKIRSMADFSLFIDTDADERAIRRIKRDVEQRKRSVSSVVEQYRRTVRPMHNIYVEPSKKYADLVIDGNDITDRTIEMIYSEIIKRVAAKSEEKSAESATVSV